MRGMLGWEVGRDGCTGDGCTGDGCTGGGCTGGEEREARGLRVGEWRGCKWCWQRVYLLMGTIGGHYWWALPGAVVEGASREFRACQHRVHSEHTTVNIECTVSTLAILMATHYTIHAVLYSMHRLLVHAQATYQQW
jgi:hypothetical protein